MSTRYKAKHKTFVISVVVGDFPGCCGGKIVYSYTIEQLGEAMPLEKDIVGAHHMLYRHLVRDRVVTGVLVAMDPIDVDTNGWDGGTHSSSILGHGTLENFCLDNYFEVEGWSKGENDRHLGVFSKGSHKQDDTRIPLPSAYTGITVSEV